jgi:hypothetical protein
MASLHDEEGNQWTKQSDRENRLNTGVKGVHAVSPFQCETCWMRNLEGRDPVPDDPKDQRYIQCIRRASLDAMAGRAKSTVESHSRKVNEVIRNCKTIGRSPRLEPRGPFPIGDLVGMGWAVDLLLKSLISEGRVGEWIQFDTMRDLRGTFTKLWSSSPTGIAEGASFSGNASKIRFTSCPSQSEWFGDFLLGAEDRMGYDTKKQLYLPIPVILEQLRLIQEDAADSLNSQTNLLYKLGALICILTAGSLRGHEGFYLDLASTRKFLDKGRHGVVPPKVLTKAILTDAECNNLPEVCVCLVGKFKGETGENFHSLVLANVTSSGLNVRWWVEKLIAVCESEGQTTGYAFFNPDGTPPNSYEYNALVREYLKRIQMQSPELFSITEDLSRYGISRTYRKSAESRTRKAGIKEEDVKVMNRWRVTEQAKGKRPRRAMVDHYADARALVSVTWRCSYAL